MTAQFDKIGETTDQAVAPLNAGTILYVLRKGRFVVLESVILFTLIGLVFIHTQNRLYTAMAIVAPQESNQASIQSGSSALQALGTLSGVSLNKGGNALDEFLGTLDTPLVASNLQAHYGMLQKAFAGSWDQKSQRWKSEPYDGIINGIMALPQSGAPDIFSLAGYVTRSIKSVKDRETGFVTLRYSNTNPQFATYFLTTLCLAADETMRDAAKRRAAGNISFLQEKLKTVGSADLRQALITMVEDQERSLMLANSGETYAFRYVQPPITSDSPTWPASKKILMAASLVGFVFGFAISIFLYWSVQGRSRWARDFRRVGSVTVYLMGLRRGRRA